MCRHLDDGSLVELLPQHRPAPMPVQVVYPHRRHLRVQAFMAWMAELLSGQRPDR
jgi:DNA-binding transcriptional LysR family regulator